MTLVERMWEMIDQEFAILESDYMQNLTESDYNERDTLRGKLRGMAEMIALFMSPYFKDANEVTREVVKRKRMRDSGEAYETPGIGNRRFETPPNDPSKYAQSTQHSRPPAPKIEYVSKRQVDLSHNLTDAEVTAIKSQMETGMIAPDMLAGAFGVSVDVIRHLAKS